jgi:hypothetical protein
VAARHNDGETVDRNTESNAGSQPEPLRKGATLGGWERLAYHREKGAAESIFLPFGKSLITNFVLAGIM